jgi:lysylphosphatidylglycerol synthetase-like protein (DUF2156 family)
MAIDERMPPMPGPASEASVPELVNRARDELALAKVEMTAKAKRAGVGGGLLGTAGLLGVYAVGLLLALAVVLLDLVWPLWVAVLVVLVVVLAMAAVAALVGRRQLQRAAPPVPTDVAAGLAADLETVKAAVRDGRHR